MLRGTAATVRFPVARRFFRGATNTKTVRGPQQPQGKSPGNTVPGGRILKFVSRAEHLAWRARWKNGRWIKLSWTPEERSAILRQDETYRQTDARWQVNHGPIPGGARVWAFSVERSGNGKYRSSVDLRAKY
jgi:hypothetical protein